MILDTGSTILSTGAKTQSVELTVDIGSRVFSIPVCFHLACAVTSLVSCSQSHNTNRASLTTVSLKHSTGYLYILFLTQKSLFSSKPNDLLPPRSILSFPFLNTS